MDRFDYPDYFNLLKTSYHKDSFKLIAFDSGDLAISYRHNTPAKEFFKEVDYGKLVKSKKGTIWYV